MAHFDNAPLIEIVVELKWESTSAFPVAQPGQPPMHLAMPGNPGLDEFYMRFGGLAYTRGLKRATRLAPPDFPIPVGNVVYRYQRETGNAEDDAVMWQLGPSVFTANALPPYKRWSVFRPTVEQGVEALLDTRPPAERDLPFTMSLRYLDAFRGELLGKSSLHGFVEEVLGFRLQLPDAVARMQRQGSEPRQVLQLELPIHGERTLAINLSGGQFANEPAVIMQSTVLSDAPVPADKSALMSALDAAQGVLHESFDGMTTRIRPLMRPAEEN